MEGSWNLVPTFSRVGVSLHTPQHVPVLGGMPLARSVTISDVRTLLRRQKGESMKRKLRGGGEVFSLNVWSLILFEKYERKKNRNGQGPFETS